MTRLTWQNVEAPDLGRAADILNSAALQIGSGGTSIGGALRNARSDQMDRRSAAVLPILAGIQGSGDVAGALSRIGGMIRPEDMNEETRKAYLGLMGQGVGFDATRAGTAAVRGAEGRAQTNADRGWAQEDQAASLAGDIERVKENARYGPVGRTGSNGLPDNERDLLALTLQAEAGGEGYQGMLAAGSVVANRVKTGKYGVGFGGVITKQGQFSYLNGVTGYNGGEGAIDPSNIKVSDEAYAAADAIMSGNYTDQTGGATHYYNDSVADPAWGANRAGGSWVRVGNHVFGSPDGNGGTSENRMSSVIPENNLLSPEFWDGQGDDLWANEEEAYGRGRSRANDVQTDEQTAYDRARSRAADAKTAKDAEMVQWALDQATNVATGDAFINPTDAIQAAVNSKKYSVEQLRALAPAIRQAYGDFAEMGDTSSLPAPVIEGYDPVVVENQIFQMQTNADFNEMTNPAMRGLDASNIPVDVNTGIKSLRQSATDSGVEMSDSDADVINIVNKVADKFGVDERFVLAAAQNKMSSGWFGSYGIDEDRLVAAMDELGSRDDWQAVQAMRKGQDDRMASATELQGKMSTVSGEIAAYQLRDPDGTNPDAQAAIKQRIKKLGELQVQLQQVVSMDNLINPSEDGQKQQQQKAEEAKAAAENLSKDILGKLVKMAPKEENQIEKQIKDALAKLFKGSEVAQSSRSIAPTVDQSGRNGFDTMSDAGVMQSMPSASDIAPGTLGMPLEDQASLKQVGAELSSIQASLELRGSTGVVSDWFGSMEAAAFFVQNPSALLEAKMSPDQFYRTQIKGSGWDKKK